MLIFKKKKEKILAVEAEASGSGRCGGGWVKEQEMLGRRRRGVYRLP